MKRMLFAIQVFALSALVASGDEKKDAPKEVPDHLKGQWRITAVTNGERFITCGSSGLGLTIAGNQAEWKSVPLFAEKAGKATISAEGKDNKGSLQLKIGDKVYNGIYAIELIGEQKEPLLDIYLGGEGKPAPKAFPKTFKDFPNDVSFKIQCDRKKLAP